MEAEDFSRQMSKLLNGASGFISDPICRWCAGSLGILSYIMRITKELIASNKINRIAVTQVTRFAIEQLRF